MKYFIANWKANKNFDEAISWVNELTHLRQGFGGQASWTIIICPAYPLIAPVKKAVGNRPNIFIGAQDVSQFDKGAHTGEVPAYSLAGLVDFAIVGHSERRDMGETDEVIESKIRNLQKYNIKPILCIRGKNDKIPPNISFVAYEPVENIGTGKNKLLKETLEVKKTLNLNKSTAFIYGAGVSEGNIKEYLESSEIDGLLMGTASLDPQSFYRIISL